MAYGDALPDAVRNGGSVPVMSSGGVTGEHDVANTGSPAIVLGRKGSHGSVWWTDQPAFVIDTAYFIDDRRSGVDLRWLFYVLLAARLGELSNDVGVPGLSREVAYEALVPVPPALDEQRQIADFLDDQVGRIEGLARERARQATLSDEVEYGLLHELLGERGVVLPDTLDGPIDPLPPGWRVGELGHVLRELTNGYVGPTRDILVDDGVRYIQSLHIKQGGINFDRRPYFVTEEWHRQRPRIHLGQGDVLIVQTGDIGQVAVVPADFGEASCHALQIARVEPAVISGAYLGEYLRSTFGQAQLLARATGALHPHLEAGVKNTPVVVPPIHTQQDLVDEMCRRRDEVTALRRNLSQMVTLLGEFKTSLISAAVSGEFDVSTADGSQVSM
jgi:type I restriction enzyme S subunit